MAHHDLGDLSAYERMLYGNVEDDAELEAELMAIQDEIGVEEMPSTGKTAPVFSRKKPPSPPMDFPVEEANGAEIGDVDDPELEAELLAMQDESGEETPKTEIRPPASKVVPPKIASPPRIPPPVEERVVKEARIETEVRVETMVAPPEIVFPPKSQDISPQKNPPRDPPNPRDEEPPRNVDAVGTNAEAFDEQATAEVFKAPPAPSTVLEALLQRLEKYKSAAQQAQQEGNASKVRRMGRIQKQYEDAIKAHKAGKPVDFDELPTPPGFGPIPIPSHSTAKPEQRTPPPKSLEESSLRPAPVAGNKRPSPAAKPTPAATATSLSKQEQELKFLMERQQQFKTAALVAKKRGDIAVAKHLLRQAMGFDQMINASRNGLRVDIANVPTPPQLKTAATSMKPAISSAPVETDVLTLKGSAKEGTILAKAGYEDVFSMLEQDLINQVKICDRNREFYLSTGDVSRVAEFEKLASGAKKDLAALRNAFKHGDQPPRFHYETRVFASINCFPELGVYDLELSVVRGIHVKLPAGYEPKDAEIYVKYDLRYPKDTPQSGKTLKIKGTNSPVFDFTTLLRINPKSRQFLHMLKRIGIKFEVLQKGGFLRSDIPLGNAEIYLLPLETQPLLHQSLDIIENRKPVGGKLEVKIRVREPLVQKQAEEVREKWLIIDQFSLPSSTSGLVAKRADAAAAFGSRQLGTGRVK